MIRSVKLNGIFALARRTLNPVCVQTKSRRNLSTSSACLGNHVFQDPIEKYRHKLEQKAKEEGLSTIDDLQKKYESVIEEKKKEFNKIDPLKDLGIPLGTKDKPTTSTKSTSEAEKERKTLGPLPPPIPKADIKTLDSYVDSSKLKLHSPKEIELLWKARFANKENAFCGTMNGVVFSRVYRHARQFPNFVLPLPHGDAGVEFHYIQWTFAGANTLHCILTPLAEYKLHQDFAHPHVTLIFHTDFFVDKELVLMNASVEKDSSMSLEDAILLSLNVQRFYGADHTVEHGARKIKLLHSFNSGSEEFSTEALINEAETLD